MLTAERPGIRFYLPAGLTQKREDGAEGQSDDVGVTAVEAGYRVEVGVLDGVAAGFVEGIALGDVSFDLGVAVGPHPNLCGDATGERHVLFCVQQSDAGVNRVGYASQPPEHGAGGYSVAGFAQGLIVQRHDGIRGQNPAPPVGVGSVGLGAGQAHGQAPRRLTGKGCFIKIAGRRLEVKPQPAQKPASSWGSRRQPQCVG